MSEPLRKKVVGIKHLMACIIIKDERSGKLRSQMVNLRCALDPHEALLFAEVSAGDSESDAVLRALAQARKTINQHNEESGDGERINEVANLGYLD